MSEWDNKFVVLGVTGGIAAYRACELARLMVTAGLKVQPVLTESAAAFVGPLTFQGLCGRPAEVGTGGRLAVSGMEHIDFGREADLMVLSPLTANTMAKLAHGLADNLLTSTVLASQAKVLLAPAMNTRMWENPQTQENFHKLLQQERFFAVGPTAGSLACGETGSGRMAEPGVIFEAVERLLSASDFSGRKILITAGPTREKLDPVRYLSNRSSGRMGFALAKAAFQRKAEVVLIAGPCSLAPPHGVRTIFIETAAEMGAAVKQEATSCDAIIMAAAVADFRPKEIGTTKIKKKKMSSWDLALEPTEDILAWLGKEKQQKLLIGFAAEWGPPQGEAQRKLKEKNLDLVVANDVSLKDAGFDVDTNRVWLVDAQKSYELPLLSKIKVAHRILDELARLLEQRPAAIEEYSRSRRH